MGKRKQNKRKAGKGTGGAFGRITSGKDRGALGFNTHGMDIKDMEVIGSCGDPECAICDPSKMGKRHVVDSVQWNGEDMSTFVPLCGQAMADNDTVIEGPIPGKPITCQKCALLLEVADAADGRPDAGGGLHGERTESGAKHHWPSKVMGGVDGGGDDGVLVIKRCCDGAVDTLSPDQVWTYDPCEACEGAFYEIVQAEGVWEVMWEGEGKAGMLEGVEEADGLLREIGLVGVAQLLIAWMPGNTERDVWRDEVWS